MIKIKDNFHFLLKYSIFLIAASFLISEILVRIWLNCFADPKALSLFGGENSLVSIRKIYSSHHYFLYEPTLNYSDSIGTLHNNFGFRYRNIAIQKPRSVFRVFIIGGSTVYSFGIKNNDSTFSAILEKMLNNRFGVLPVHKKGNFESIEIINAGVGGYTSAETLIRLIFRISQFSPDLIILQHGLNDVLPMLRSEFHSDYSRYRKAWHSPQEFINVKNNILFAIRKSAFVNFILVQFHICHPFSIDDHVCVEGATNVYNVFKNETDFFERNTSFIISIAKSIGTDIILVTEPYNSKTLLTSGDDGYIARALIMPKLNSALKKLSAIKNIDLFDLNSLFPCDSKYFFDGIHVNEMGASIESRLYFDYLVNQYKLFDKIVMKSVSQEEQGSK